MDFLYWRKINTGSSTDRRRVDRAVDGIGGTFIRVISSVAIFLCGVTALAATANPSETRDFHIPQLRADKALTMFAEQADLTLIFSFEIAKERQANETIGSFTIADAAEKLLDGTDLHPVFRNEGGLSIELITDSDVEEKEVNNNRKRGIGALLSSLFLGPAVTAQEVNLDELTVEEIVVTAQIREESYQDVPVTGTVFDAATIADDRLFEIDDIARFTPGFAASYSTIHRRTLPCAAP